MLLRQKMKNEDYAYVNAKVPYSETYFDTAW